MKRPTGEAVGNVDSVPLQDGWANVQAAPEAPLELTPLEFQQFLRGGLAEKGAVEFRLIGRGKPPRSVFMRWPAHEHMPDVFTLAQVPAGYSPYFGLSLRNDGSSGRAENCHATALAWVDFDLKGTPYVHGQTDVLNMTPEELREAAQALFADVMTRCEALGLPPRAAVYTGHGLQLYWAQGYAPTKEETEARNRALVAEFGAELGADSKTVDIARVFRVPGSQNLKNPARPLPVEIWHADGAASINPEVLDALAQRHAPRSTPAPALKAAPSTAPDGGNVIEEWNRRNPIQDVLERYGYVREDAKTYTRPGDDASGRDVKLLENSKGVLCSYHHSSNDPLDGGNGDGHLREPFDLYAEYEHGGDMKAAVKAAAAELGMSYPSGTRKSSSKGQEDTDSDDDRKRPPAGTRVLEYAQEDGAELWHDQSGNAYLTATVGGHREHYRLPSRGARDYLQALYYARERRALNGQAQGEAVGLMQALARREGKEYCTAVRLAHIDGFTYIDLGTPTWEAVEIGKGYWKVIRPHECPVRFTRPPGFLPLPEPVDGGDLRELGEFLNTDRRGLMMCTAWLLAAASGISPYPVLALSGEQGTGKSTAASVLRNLLDPNQADRRRAPKEERDLFISAQNTHVLSYDNLSSVPAWLSDALCVLSTGGAFTARTLYSDNEETILDAVRPVIMNGIPDLLARPDLAERALTVTLQRIPDDRRTPEKVFWERYERARARLLGALLTALGCALKELEHTELEQAPRLADFARLIVAGEAALPWSGGEFLRAYTQMQSEAAVTVLEGEPVAEALRAFIADKGEWTGTVKKLLGILEEREYPDTRPPAAWPKTPRAFGAALRRLAPALSKTGYSVAPAGRSKEGERYTLSLQKEGNEKEGNESALSSPHTPATSGTAKNMGEHSQGDVHPGAATYTQTGGAGVLQAQRVNIGAATYTRKNAVPDGTGEHGEHGAHSFPSLSTEGEL